MRIYAGSLLLLALAVPAFAAPALDEDGGAELATVKERELEAVREQISALKKSMAKRATDRDRITADFQDA